VKEGRPTGYLCTVSRHSALLYDLSPSKLTAYSDVSKASLCLLLQFWLTMQYLANMSEEQTLVMCSGHPLGLFPSRSDAPRVVITNGMVIPNYSSKQNYDNMFALGVTM